MTKPKDELKAKQEKIREGMAEYLWENRVGETTASDWADTWVELPEMNKEGYREDAGAFMIYLHSQGVVIKVDRELPLDEYHMASQFPKIFNGRLDIVDYSEKKHEYLSNAKPIMNGMCKAGYVAVEPLIEDGK